MTISWVRTQTLTADILAIVGGWWGILTADEWVYSIAGQEGSETL